MTPAEFRHPDAHKALMMGSGQEANKLSVMYKIVLNLILIETIKYVKLQRKLIILQHILANQKTGIFMRCNFPLILVIANEWRQLSILQYTF